MIQFEAKKRLGKKTMKNSEGVAIAVIQLNSSFDVSRSLKALDLQLQKITPGEVAAIFLPENFAALAAPSPLAIGQREAGGEGPIRDYLKQQSRSLEAYIFAGTLPLAVRPDGQPVPEGRVRAASFVLDPGGREVARYDKKHLFDVFVEDGQGQYLESATFEPGQALCVSETTFGAVGLSVCYDLRFPELYRSLTAMGAEIISVPSAFTQVTGKAHFEVLLRARAIENGCFVVAACQAGAHDSGRETFGHSMVVSPWGSIIAVLPEGEGVLKASLDFEELHRFRAQIPSWHSPSVADHLKASGTETAF